MPHWLIWINRLVWFCNMNHFHIFFAPSLPDCKSCFWSTGFLLWRQLWQRGILVKLVICVSSGQLKIKIANLMQYAILAYFLPFSNTLSLENMIGNLIAPLTKLLYHIIGNSMSRGDLQNIMQWVWQDKSICLPQMNCQRLHIDGKKYSRNQSCHFFKNLQHVTFVHTDTIAAFISSGQCLENLFFSFQMIMPSEIKYLLCVWDVFETILEWLELWNMFLALVMS